MKQIELTEKELSVLVEVLQTSLSELKTEIAHTDTRDYRMELKDREAALEGFLHRLESTQKV